ncbi:actin interacting protein 3-domain-containing protein [Neohortaea acidophila]|uniref:Actin interacting protein 3-domain-containing protein n=1 Tax=Neohortaea acidophila TaxID=245834 RepID=A0A6A6PKG6_9PEZI|nr:actin interacting protein 3-domain-containing protein [Neohortaea acidophila]KAF2479993.1 actin interacting protein 3-domain-containing protein [Neohortaea acidophila]
MASTTTAGHVSQRRNEEPTGYEGTATAAPTDNAAQDLSRSSAGSARSSSNRSRANPQQQLSTIEKSVTHLLVATKQLLETLTLWSRGGATETEVSDVYVRLGYEFNIACRAFSAIGVDTNDLGPVPDQLRTILEDTLSQEASQASLDKYLPRIRDIIINLLHGLKKKQQRLRQRGSTREGVVGADGRVTARQTSVASNASAESQLAQHLDDLPTRTSSARSGVERQSSAEHGMPGFAPRTSSGMGRSSPKKAAGLSPQSSMRQSPSRDTISNDSGTSTSSNALQNIPVMAPYLQQDTIPAIQLDDRPEQLSPSQDPPRPPPKQNDALSALQKSGDLERRASRRFSSYQIQKHLGTSMNGMSAIPPAQHSPIPNRGRDVQESLSAVRSRGSAIQSRARSRNKDIAANASPSRMQEVRRISEEPSNILTGEAQPPMKPTTQDADEWSPMAKTPEDKLGSYPFPETTASPEKLGATLNGPVPEPMYAGLDSGEERPKAPVRSPSRKLARQRTPPPAQFVAEGSPQPGKELTLFLQYKSKIKKFVLPDGGDLSLARLQLAFIEKFAWNTQNNGVDLPEIYIQDPISGVRHELEELTDIRERSVLVLNVEALDEVKRHFDDGIGGLRRIVEGIRTSVEDQHTALQRVSDRQQETAKDLASIAAAPPTAPAPPTGSTGSRSVSSRDQVAQLSEVTKLRRDLAVVRQTYSSFVSDMNATMTTIKAKASGIKKAAADSVIPDMNGATGRTYVDNGKKQLSADSEKIVNRVDDLQDMVEDLRKDVVSRGVRPLPRQLEGVSKDISVATADLKKLQEFLKREKPVWTKIWEKELQVVCDDRDLLTLQEELAVDLEDDLEKAAATFALVEQATKQQNLHKPSDSSDQIFVGSMRSASGRNLKPIAMHQSSADPHKAKDSVLGEVRALQPNHESRLEAIERAEKARQKELEERKGGEFQRELGTFVEEGKLKKTGGVEEVERMRKMREEKARREVLERQAQRMRERNEKEAAAAAAAVAAPDPTDGKKASEANGAPPEIITNGDDTTVVKSGDEGEREKENSSPEPGFVDAKEDVSTPTEAAPSA